MLIQVSIRNLVIVESLDISFENGMTVFTGETGAGKSILIDALGLSLGERADSSLIRQGADSAEVIAVYDLQSQPAALNWLKEQALITEETECIIRRQISSDGRSRAFINGRPTPLTQIRELGEYLVALHGQHQHQRLLQLEYQRLILDEFADHAPLLEQLQTCYSLLQNLKKEKEKLENNQNNSDKITLLQFQIQELDTLDLQENEEETLSQEHRSLTHAEQWLTRLSAALEALSGEAHATSQGESASAEDCLEVAQAELSTLIKEIPELQPSLTLLGEAAIQIQEASHALAKFKDSIAVDPQRLQEIDQRLSQIHHLSRKYRVSPKELPQYLETLKSELSNLEYAEKALVDLSKKIETTLTEYDTLAKTLTANRQKTATKLEKTLTDKIRLLEMPQAIFKIQVQPKAQMDPTPNGRDEIEFLVTTNPGQPPQSLKKVASGGELSRISLSIQVIAAQKLQQPTLIFDEVDVGISGKTAETVGILLRELGQHTQIFCVTHLAQVAVKAHQHFKIEKTQTANKTTTQIKALSATDKVQEIARLIGGHTLTQSALDHAKVLLELN